MGKSRNPMTSCAVCEKILRQDNMKRHMRTHSYVRVYDHVKKRYGKSVLRDEQGMNVTLLVTHIEPHKRIDRLPSIETPLSHSSNMGDRERRQE